MKTGDMNISSAKKKASMYAAIPRCTISEQEGEHPYRIPEPDRCIYGF
jgi:hypothetical protein